MLRFLKRKKRDPKDIIQELFGDTELPSFPSAVMEVMSLLRNPDSAIRDIEFKIERDPGLSVKVLRTVNSAAFGLSKNVGHVGHAVSLLGRSRLESIVLSVAVNAVLPQKEDSGFDFSAFWSTAAKRACLAKLLAQQFHPITEIEAFTAGLLQDMGIPLLAMQKGNEYVKVYQKWQNDPLSSLEDLEQEAFSFDHTQVGSIVAATWDLPQYLVDAIAGHHTWGGDHHVEEAVQLVSLLRDSVIDDGSMKVIEVGVADFGANFEQLEILVAKAIEDAQEYYKMLMQ
ncbi:MAG: HDOD domain-containing protein [Rhodothermales bacterium]